MARRRQVKRRKKPWDKIVKMKRKELNSLINKYYAEGVEEGKRLQKQYGR